jgi:hypothetical protein
VIIESARYCADHGFYHDREDCPRCGKTGATCVMDEDGELQPDYPDRCDE